jgi:hypothetical protein
MYQVRSRNTKYLPAVGRRDTKDEIEVNVECRTPIEE